MQSEQKEAGKDKSDSKFKDRVSKSKRQVTNFSENSKTEVGEFTASYTQTQKLISKKCEQAHV